MRTLIIGDTHTDSSILHRVDTVGRVDSIILLGDYMDDWNASVDERIHMADELRASVESWTSVGITVKVLLGNHDIAYFLGRDNPFFNMIYYSSPGFDQDAERVVHDIYQHIPFGIMTTIRHHGMTWLCSHAGITASWSHHIIPGTHDPDDIADKVNGMDDWRKLFMCGPARGGHDRYPSPLWADMYELMKDHPAHINQIVGHTPVPAVSMLIDGSSRLIFADTFSTMPDGRHIGDSSAIIMDDDDGNDHGYGVGIRPVLI